MGIPLVKDAAVAAANFARGRRFGEEWDSPLFTGIDIGFGAMRTVIQLITDLDNDKKWKKATLAILELLGFGAKIPIVPRAKDIIKGMEQWESGEGTPFNVLIPQTSTK